MAEKKKKGRRSYLADYVQDVNGQYVYTGSHYLAQTDGASMPRLLRGIFGLLLLAMLALIGVGCLSTGTASGAFYVTLPHVAAIVLGALCLYDCGVVLQGKGCLRSHVYERSVPRLRGSTAAGAICAGIAAVGQTVYTFVAGKAATRGADILFFVGCYLAFALFFLAFRTQKRIVWEKELGKSGKALDNDRENG